jgi:hypothetical protein
MPQMLIYPADQNDGVRVARRRSQEQTARPELAARLASLWILAAVAWLLGWGVYLSIYALRFGEETNDLLKIPVILFAPPAGLLVVGYATGWALRGFLSNDLEPLA